ncbi:CapA family protein [Gluconacetobacter asukensis]|uniref:CapA family protein n=1 Tax=Gluconacetobacter asukensis TaxID=1017181 RepID=A0A7W4J0G9_9PROT|nr:CapA family protein [Gluconacetobacter asukensis]MBB2172369.1 CapA family protein [Gluconacetobacter asukensis]
MHFRSFLSCRHARAGSGAHRSDADVSKSSASGGAARLRVVPVFLGLVAAVLPGTHVAIGASRPDPARTLSIVLTGQSLIRSDIRVTSPSTGPAIEPMLKADAVFTNFETTVGEGGETGKGFNAPSFSAPPQAVDALRSLGFNLISLANNHSWDLRTRGIENTLRKMTSVEIVHAGVGENLHDAEAPAYLTTPHGTVGLVAMASGLIARGAAAAPGRAGVNELRVEGNGSPDMGDQQRILNRIREAAKHADIVVAYHHNHIFPSSADFLMMMNEQLPERLVPPEWVKRWAHREVDAGANVVVMHGAPLLHGVEIYNGSVILYDLGNFIFQLPATPPRFEETMCWESVIASVEFKGRTLHSVTFRPIDVNKGRDDGDRYLAMRGMPAPAAGTHARYILERLARLSEPFGTVMRIDGASATIRLGARYDSTGSGTLSAWGARADHHDQR